MIRRHRITFTVLLMLVAHFVKATPYYGGQLRYEYDSLDYYTVYLDVYHACSDAPMLDSQVVKLSSSCINDSAWIYKTGRDTLTNEWCPSYNATCGQSFMAVIEHYSGTVHLPACSDWVLSFSSIGLNAAIANITNPGYLPLYVEAGLDNSTSINNSTLIASNPAFIMPVSADYSMPMQNTDADADSVEIVFSQPPAPYFLGYPVPYTMTSPFGMGSYSVIDNINQEFDNYAPNQGIYYMYLKINEYRNNTLIGYSTRVWTGIVMNTNDPEIPFPVTGSQFEYTIHPGQSDTITLNFTDSAVTDSVYADFHAGSYPNLTTSVSSIPGIGTASTTLICTASANFNIADSPYINIPIYVHDNACDHEGYAFYNVLLYIAQPNADSVWPGDANGDHTVNMYDPLAIATAYGNTGTTRVGANLSWTAQYSTDWATNFITGINHKHADCNGDGLIDNSDTLAVTLNYGMTHPKQYGHAAKVTGLPDLRFDLANTTFLPGFSVSIPLKLGDAASPMNNIYGLATNIKIQGPTLTTTPGFSYTGSWISTAASAVKFTKDISNENIDWVYARTDHQNVSGQGTIAYMNFTVPANANLGDMIVFKLSNTKIIDKDGNEVTGYNAVDDTAYVMFPVDASIEGTGAMAAVIAPNPSEGKAILRLTSTYDTPILLNISDITGRLIYHNEVRAAKGTHVIDLPKMSRGVYYLQVQNTSGSFRENIKWVCE